MRLPCVACLPYILPLANYACDMFPDNCYRLYFLNCVMCLQQKWQSTSDIQDSKGGHVNIRNASYINTDTSPADKLAGQHHEGSGKNKTPQETLVDLQQQSDKPLPSSTVCSGEADFALNGSQPPPPLAVSYETPDTSHGNAEPIVEPPSSFGDTPQVALSLFCLLSVTLSCTCFCLPLLYTHTRACVWA